MFGFGEAEEVRAAIERWLADGHISPEQAEALAEESAAHARVRRRRRVQYALAITAGAVTVLAAAIFLGWSWPRLGPVGQTGILAAVGALLAAVGVRLEATDRLLPVAFLLQTSGLAVLLVSLAHSREAWADGTPVAVALGVAGALLPIAGGLMSVRRNHVMPAIETAFAFGFLAVALNRATPLSDAGVLWVLDAVLVLALVGFAAVYARRGRDADWALHSLLVALYAGLLLVLLTAAEVGDMGDRAFLPVDAWLALMVALALWAIHGAPAHFRRPWMSTHLAACAALAIVLSMATTAEVFEWPAGWVSLAGAAVGAAALVYGLATDTESTVLVGCAGLVVSAWFYQIESDSPLGGVLALGLSAALLFWLAARWGRERAR